ncbi:RNA polymerase sigma factor [Olivibacter sp. XZL3]|uniref:RNA polymerase sigma factor n=1 Tax=Olivibacter sp. XZL3 TaxID=1735116 RepID=UPI00106660E0|nr:sigma-70 family RNA polymerase sigma factor [Olivibacter sp. XZL3]
MDENLNVQSDIELMRRIAAGDTIAFRLIYDKYWKTLYLKAKNGTDEEEAKDIVQEILLSLWNGRHRVLVNKETDLRNYLFTAVKYKIISFYAYSAAKVRRMDLLQPPETVHTPETVLLSKELKMQLDQVVNEMPQKMQQIFRMSRDEANTIAEIAARLNLSEQTVKNQLSNALKRLRRNVTQTDDQLLVMTLLLYIWSI